MAGKFQLGLNLLAYTVTASSSIADHPAANLTIRKPFITWKAATATDGAESLIVDLGSAKSPQALFLNNANFAAFTVEAGADGTTWPDTIGSPGGIDIDARVQRRKSWFPMTMTTPRRFLKITAYTPDAGITGIELGTLVVVGTVETLVYNWGTDIPWVPLQAASSLGIQGGGTDFNTEGRRYLSYPNLHGAPWRTASMAQLLALHAIDKGAPFVMYENRDNTAMAYLLKRTADAPFAERFRTFDASWSFEEFI